MSNIPHYDHDVNPDIYDAWRQFREAMESVGILAPHEIHDGEVFRFPARNGKGRTRNKNGAFEFHSDGWPAGWYQNHGVTGVIKWCYKTDKPFTSERMAELKAESEAAAVRREIAKEKAYAEAARRAQRAWEDSEPAETHRYLEDKGVASYGLRANEDGELLIPVMDIDGNWQSLQRIFYDEDEKSAKLFLQGGRMEGGMFVIGEIVEAGVILIGEGYATMATLRDATGYASICAFNDSNVIKVTAAIRAKFPSAKIVVCADNDHATIVNGKHTNPGVTKSKIAAKESDALLAIPTVEEGTDFNDMASEIGIEAVRDAIEAVINKLKKAKTMAKKSSTVTTIYGPEVVYSAPVFEMDGRNGPKRNFRNLKTAISALGVELTYDEFSMVGKINGEPAQDHVVNKMLFDIDEKWGIQFQKDYFYNAVDTLARENKFHPVKDYLSSLEWDGVSRLETALSKFCGADNNPINGVVFSKWMIGGVRRIFTPGCIMRTVLILEGEQWAGKSSFFEVLAKRKEWFLNDLDMDGIGRDILPQIMGKWIVELSELDSVRKSDIGTVKKNIAQTFDRGRLSHARYATELLRQYVYAGTTNKREYLNDSTGGTRFWPVRIEKVNFPDLIANVDHLWAEAVHRANAGESHELDADQTAAIKVVQDEKAIIDPWQELIVEFLADKDGAIDNCKVKSDTLFNVLGVKQERRTQPMLERIGSIMAGLGFARKNARFGGKVGKGYVKGKGDNEKV
jgi:putative DNA primase/helicase